MGNKQLGGIGQPATVHTSIFDAKGDLLAARGNDVVTTVPIGTDGQVLTADSATDSGLGWATPAAAGITATGTEAATTTDVLARRVTGDTSDRFVLNADGSIDYSDGSAAVALGLSVRASNTTLGLGAGDTISGGVSNTCIGNLAGTALSSGVTNTVVGAAAAPTLNIGGTNTLIGAACDAADGNTNNAVALGYQSVVASNATALGAGTIASAAGSIAIGRDSTGAAALAGAVNGAVIGTALTTLSVGNPGGGAGAWMLGIFRAGAVALDAANYVEISIGGVVRKLLVST